MNDLVEMVVRRKGRRKGALGMFQAFGFKYYIDGGTAP